MKIWRMLPFAAVLLLFVENGQADQRSAVEQARQSFRIYKEMALDEIGPFEFERRSYYLETIDELCRVIRSFPDRDIITTKETKTIGDSPVLDLIDIDGDGKADSYVYSAESGSSTQHFGYVFDLNDDGAYDHVVFSQGIQMAKPFKIISTFYHMIDTNYDGQIDAWVRPDTDLDHDGAVDEGVFSWLYDVDYDGRIDNGDYLGMGVSRPMACEEDVIEIECVMANEIDVGDAEILSFGTSMLMDMNSTGRQ